jgi:prepilin-type N-terminal cleavage/methylation domain-containing protein
MTIKQASHSSSVCSAARQQRGTTLIELMVALAVFLIVSGAGFTLFNSMQKANTNLQEQQGLSLALRSAASQLQLDLGNAGNGYFQGINIPSWPVGVTIMNTSTGSSCYSSSTGYAASCFDQLNIITARPDLYPAVNPTDSNGDTSPSSCPSPAAPTGTNPAPGSNTTKIYTLFPSGYTSTQAQAEFATGDQLMLLHTTSTGTLITTTTVQSVTLNSASNAVALTVNQTYSDGSNIIGNDPYDITSCDRTSFSSATPYSQPNTTSCPSAGSASPYTPTFFGTTFCGTGDWVVKLVPIQYKVQATSNPNNPWQLVRIQNGTTSVIMDQIIGFRVGAAIWNAVDTGSGYNVPTYNYQASTYAIGSLSEGYNFSLVRSVRASIIARTAPSATSASMFQNSFDGGAYQVRGTVVVVNPRNLSMNDDQTQAIP